MSLSKLEKGSVEFAEDVTSDVSLGHSNVLIDSSGDIRRLPIPSKDPNDPLNFPFAAKLGIIVSCCWFSMMSLSVTGGLGSVLGVFDALYAPEGVSATEVGWLTTFPSLFIGIGNYFILPLGLSFGRRPATLMAIIVLLAATIGCGFTQTYDQHLALRIIQGRLMAEEGFCYHHAVHAAIACATKRINISVDSDKYTGVFCVDGRGPFNMDYHPATIYSTVWFPSIHVTDFRSVMRQFRHDYQEIVQDPMLPNVVDEMIGISISLDQCEEFCTAEALLTNLGHLERFIPDTGREVEVVEYDFHCEVLTPAINVYLYIQRNELTLKACYNDTYHAADMVTRFLEMVMEELHKGFNLPMYVCID